MNLHKTNLDDVLDKFSIFGRYHLVFMCYAMFAYAVSELSAFTYVFVAKRSGYTCSDEGFSNNSCGNVEGMRCSNWIYDDPDSFVAEFQLACQEWKRTLLGTAHVFGNMIGLFMVGPLSDRFKIALSPENYYFALLYNLLWQTSPLFTLGDQICQGEKIASRILENILMIGRKKTVIISGLLNAITGLLQSLVKSYWIYIALEILKPMIGDIYSPLFVLNMEIVSAKNRVVLYAICGLGSTFGGSITAVAAWAIPYWRYLLLAVHMPGFLFLAFIITLDESPRWLLTKGKEIEAIALLLKMGEKSKVHLDKNALDKLQAEEEVKRTTLINLFKITLKSKTLLKRFLVCIVWWTTSCFVNYGATINSVSLQGNMYVNYLLLELVYIPASFITWYLLNYYKRRLPLMCTFFAAAVLFLLHTFLPDGLPWLSVIIYLSSKLMQALYFNMTYIYTSELFPTYTRNSMHAMCSAIGRIGAMIAPQTPLLMVYWTHFPTILFSGLSLLAGLLTFLVPDTANNALPDTVREAENIGVKKNENKRDVTGIDNLAMTETN